MLAQANRGCCLRCSFSCSIVVVVVGGCSIVVGRDRL